MRDYQRKEFERPRLNLVRGADGRLRTSGGWARTEPQAGQRPVRPSEPSIGRERQASGQAEHSQAASRVRADAAAGLPKFKLSSLPFAKLKKVPKKHAIVVAGALTVMALGVIGYSVMGRDRAAQDPPVAATPNIKNTEGPQFHAVLPAGKKIEDLGGWARVSPSNEEPVFAYVDVTDGVQLNISQQVLPKRFKANTAEELAKLAEGFAANEKIIVGDTTAYLGTSIRGPQSFIFVKQDLLILIKSSGKLTNQQWADYVSSLH